MNPPGPPSDRRLLTPGVVLWLAVAAGYCLVALFPIIKRRLGIFDQGMWFMDSYAVLASSDAVRTGLDPFQPNPLDVLQRPHSYSSWWFLLGKVGFTRDDNFLVGGAWALAFVAAAASVARPRRWREVLIAAAVLLSPPVLLAVNRANNDLVVFALLAAGLWFMKESSPGRLVAFAVALMLATGLKFYPFIAGVALLLVRPPRRGFISATLAVGISVLVLASVWSDFRHAVFPAPKEAYTFGVPVIFRDLGITGSGAMLAGVGLVTLGAFVCVWRGWHVDLRGTDADLRARIAFAAGAALLVGCFLAGISHAYRLIYVVFLLPWLWRQTTGMACALTLLLLVILWLDGLYCLGANLLIGPMPLAELVHRQLIWRFLTQPIVWAGMILLAGSLLGMARDLWQDWRKAGEAHA